MRVDGPDLWKIFVSAIGFGFGAEALRRYRAFKARRRATPREIRNAGFWTDSRLYHAEAAFAALALCPPWTFAILLLSAGRPLWVAMLVTLLYPAMIYILMRGMNMDEPQ